MSFNVNNSTYNSYLSNNSSFSSAKLNEMEKFSNKTLNEVKSGATTTITKNGKTYYLVKVDGESYLYDYENDTYTKYNKDGNSIKETTYNAQSDSASVADQKEKRRENFSYDATKDTDQFEFLTATRDNNIFAKNVAVIDDFEHPDYFNISGSCNQISFSHGEIVSAIIEAGGSKVTKMDGIEFTQIAAHLQTILNNLESGKDIDSVNMSISVGAFPSLLDTDKITSQNAETLYNSLKGTQGAEDIISILDKIKQLSEQGVSITIAAGNEADDTGNDKSNPDSLAEIIGYNKTIDSTKNGRDYNVFNLLTLTAGANNRNIHVIGSSNDGTTKAATEQNSDFYSNYNDLVDKLFDGDINFQYVSDNNDGTHKFYIEGVGYCDLSLNADQLSQLKGKSFNALGTSFAAPNSIAKNDSSLT